ncbi:protein diaphanous homolog 1 isoform X3 [Gadus morhua]|uniref:protein diaphanous homolog 1 isoform X3 n=1 Tax=Gadus morhua TaxID=8049 RepID=UPI0011B81175|nr:protein diaphanous homolog 1-like isoform X3 [Gadus morhua]
MMQGLGLKKREYPLRMDIVTEELPQLSNEMQLSIMNKVKNGELSIEDALHQAERERKQLLQHMDEAEEVKPQSQYNFSVHKHGRYRWQKRVLQIDFKTQMVCSIEKGIVNRQLPFSRVKNCDDGAGSRFSISFRDHHDYELEATSLEDKHKMMQLVNQIIYGNIYCPPVEVMSEAHPQSPTPSQCILEGVLLLHRGGLASFKWVKYEAQLHPGQLILLPAGRPAVLPQGESTPTFNNSKVLHLSDGDTRVERSHSLDTFTLITHKNEYQFRVPITAMTMGPMSIVQSRDAWVQAVGRLCKDWRRKSQLFYTPDSLTQGRPQVATGLSESGSERCRQEAGDADHGYPPADYEAADLSDEDTAGVGSGGGGGGGGLPAAVVKSGYGDDSPAEHTKPTTTPSSISMPAAPETETVPTDLNPHPASQGVAETPPTFHDPVSDSPAIPPSPLPTPCTPLPTPLRPAPMPPSPLPSSPSPLPTPFTPLPTSDTPSSNSLSPLPSSVTPSSNSLSPLPSSTTPSSNSLSPLPSSTTPSSNSLSPLPSSVTPSSNSLSPLPSSPRPTPTPPSPSPTTHAPLPADTTPSPFSQLPPAPPPPPGHQSEVTARRFRIPPPPPLPLKPKAQPPKRRTKAFHWDQVGSDKIDKSFWKHGSARKVELDTERLYEQFAVQDLGKFGAIEPSHVQHIMLNAKIAHNFNIFLKSFRVQPGELKDKLFIVNEAEGGLSDEQIASLRRYVPTPDDVEMYKSHKGPLAELHIVDRYMMEMCNISYLSRRLDILLTLRELPVSMKDLQPLIEQKIRMCTELLGSGSFVAMLEYLLVVGNFLNKNAGKTAAKGFRLSSLSKLAQLRGRDRTFTLLHALVEQLMLHQPCMLMLIQELEEFETVPGASIKGLTAEVDVLKNELQKVLHYRKVNKKENSMDQHQKFSKDLKMAIGKYKTDISLLSKKCEEMKKLYSELLVKFGEPMDQDSQELFGCISQFLHDFKKIHAEFQ